MLFHRLLLALIVSVSALVLAAPAAHVLASADIVVGGNSQASALALASPAGAILPGNAIPGAATDMAQSVKPSQPRVLDNFPFVSNCFNFCNGSFGGCFNFCRPVITGCFNFVGCHSISPFFFPFFNRFPVFNRFNFNFNFGSMVNCIRIMRMPGGGSITIRVC